MTGHVTGRVTDASCLVPTQPNPTQPIISLVTSSGRVTSVDAREAPPSRCPKHQHETGPVPACGACATARKQLLHYENAKAAEAERAKRQRRRAIDDCPDCDDNGMRETARGLTRCRHTEAAHA